MQEAWAVWASSVAHDAKYSDQQLLEGAVGTLFQPGEAAELWQAVTEGQGSTLALAVTLKSGLQQLLRDLEVAGSSPQLLTGAQAAVGTLKLVQVLVAWHVQSRETHNWCGKQWRPVVNLVLGWAPPVFAACMDQLILVVLMRVHPRGAILHRELGTPSTEEAVKLAASSCLTLAACFLEGGAADWLPTSPLLQALSAWIRVAEQVGKQFEPVDNQQTRPGPFEVRHLLRLLVSALGCHGEEGRFTRDRGLFARSLAKDTGLLLATARLSMFTASRGFPKEYGEACFSLTFCALQILACSELQPGMVEACLAVTEMRTWLMQSIPAAAELLSSVWEASGLKFGAIASKGSRDGGGSGNSSGQYNTTTAGTGLGSGVGLDAVLPGFAVHTAGVFWRYSVLLGRLQQQLVLKCHDEQAKVVQWACYVALRAVHSVLSEVLTALLACSNTEAPPDSANTAWQPGSQLEQQLLWKLAVSCRGALDNLVGVLTADRPYRTVVNVKHGPAPKLRASDEIAHMRCVLETGAFCLWAGMHPLWHSLWAATDAAAQQEMGLQSGDGLGGDNELAEQASEERVLLALQYHLQRLAQVPGHAALRHVLLNLVSAQKVVLMRLAAGTGDEMLVRRESLKAHLQILLALLPTIRAVPAYNAGEAVGRSVGICHYRQLQGAAIQAQVSLNGLCRCFAKLERAALGLGISYPEPAWRQSVQRAKDALTVNLQTVTMGARDADPTAGVGMLMDLFFTRMESYLQTQPARAVTLLPLAEDLLKHVAGCIAVRSMAVAMVVGCLCLRLADFLIAVLRVRRALTEDDPQFSASVQQLQKLGCQLVRTCCQAVDSVAGTDLLEDEKEVETTGGIRVRQWLAEGSDVRGAALQAALATWCQRLQVTLPRLTNAAHSAYAAGQRTRIVVRSPARSGAGSPISGGHVTMLAVRQELSLSAILACANPSCSGQAAAFGRGIKLRLCAGCRGARYCSDDCARLDWTRHRPLCKTLRELSS